MIEEFDPFFVEDPVRDEHALQDIPKLRQMTTVPLTHGEEWGLKWDFNRLVENHDVDFIRSTLPNVGGITEMMKAAAICETHAVGIVPHFTGPIATAALVNCLSTFSGPVLMEYNFGGRPIDYLPECLDFKNGKAYTNQRPGLGVTAEMKLLTQIGEVTEPGRPQRLSATRRVADALVTIVTSFQVTPKGLLEPRRSEARATENWELETGRTSANRQLEEIHESPRPARLDALGGGATLLASRCMAVRSLADFNAYAQAVRGTGPVKIRDIKTILTAPNRIRLVVVKVETTEPGLVGWGCATFTQRALVVQTAVEQYLKPFLIGRNVDEIEDIWQSSYMSSYWRNGRVLFNAMSGVDIALWDIKGKRAGMPLYQLLGGKVRHGADCYYHASGASFTEVEENARRGMEQGFRHVRVQVSTPGYASYGARSTAPAAGAQSTRPSARPTRARSGSRRRTCGCCPSSSSTCGRSSATRSSCCTTCTSASR